MVLVAPGVYYRHLDVPEVLARIRARFEAHCAAHNAEVTASSATAPRLRDQVLDQFPPAARRLAR